MKDEIKSFSELKANESLSKFSDDSWLKSLAYLANIFEKLNNLNLKFATICKQFIRSCKIGVAKQCRQMWLCLRHGQVCFKEAEELESLKTSITELIEHLQSLEIKSHRYFPELKEGETALVRNPFPTSLVIDNIGTIL